MFDLYIKNATILSMDPAQQFRIIRDGGIGIIKDRIQYVGPDQETEAARIIDGSGKLWLPGLIDSHAHAGHSLVRNLSEGYLDDKTVAFYNILYSLYTTPEFWRTEAELSALEKIKYGVTTGVSMLGSDARYDDMIYAEAHVEGMLNIGIRDILAVGTPYPPFPKEFQDWQDEKVVRRSSKTLEDSFTATREAVRRFHNTNGGLTYSYPGPAAIGWLPGSSMEDLRKQHKAMKDISLEFGVPIHSHAFAGGIQLAYDELDVLGPNLFISHVTGISEREIDILAETGTHVCSGPYTVASIRARCPVVELLQKGANVAFCSDASAPDRNYDLIEKAKIGLLIHRMHFKDPRCFSAGEALKMITINAAKAVGLEHDLGSITVGKKADIIALDMQQPHLYPIWQEPLRVVYQASGHDVTMAIIDGIVRMEDRRVLGVDEGAILERAQAEGEKMIERSGYQKYKGLPEGFWTSLRYTPTDDDLF